MTPYLGSLETFRRKPDLPFYAGYALCILANIIIVWLAVAAAVVTRVQP